MSILVLFAGCWLGGYLFPWWWPALAAYAVGAWRGRGSASAALNGFLGAGGAWAAAAAVADYRNRHILSGRMAALFHLPGPAGAVAATALAGGLMGALGGWAGYALREALRSRARRGENPIRERREDARNAAAEAAGSDSSGAMRRREPDAGGIPPAGAGDEA